MDREQYEQDLKERQERHLKNVGNFANGGFAGNNFTPSWQPCLHDQCQSCHGTGITITGASCAHALSCPCPKCTSSYIAIK